MPRAAAPTVFASIAASIAMPTSEQRKAASSGRGGNARTYDLRGLEVGKSLVVIGRTARGLNTTISTNNSRDAKNFVLDAKGNPVMVPKTADDGKTVIKGEDGKPVMVEKLKHFFAFDCDPATDPEKATARIWRDA